METYTKLARRLRSMGASVAPHEVAHFCELTVDSFFTGRITAQQAFALERELEAFQDEDQRIAKNCIRLAHTLWELIEYGADLLEGNTDDFVLSSIQNGITDLYDQTFLLKNKGWNPVLPLLRAYYDIREDIGIVQSFTFTAFMQDGELHWMQPADQLYSVLEPILRDDTSLEGLKNHLPKSIGRAVLRDVRIGYCLESDVVSRD